MSHRISNGSRVNQWGAKGGRRGGGNRRANGNIDKAARPSHVATCGYKDGDTMNGIYSPPAKANPGNVIKQKTYTHEEVVALLAAYEASEVIPCKVGGGHMGSKLASKNEAPYPETLVEPFVRSFCPPDGIVADPFSGSGTTGSVALQWGRRFVGCDVRESQVDLTRRRLQGITPLFPETTTP
jgi:DNA modification methylase